MSCCAQNRWLKRLCSTHLREKKKVLKAFLGSVHWKDLDIVINNWLMDFSTLTGNQGGFWKEFAV